MKRLDIFCFTHIASTKLEKIGYQMGGIKKKDFPDNYLTCDEKINIIEKEKYYSEYVFHYWFWKNKLKSYDKDSWVGFCQKRRFWLQKETTNKPTNFYDLNKSVLKVIPKEWENYDSVIQPPMPLKEKKMVMLKRGYKSLIKDPSIFF